MHILSVSASIVDGHCSLWGSLLKTTQCSIHLGSWSFFLPSSHSPLPREGGVSQHTRCRLPSGALHMEWTFYLNLQWFTSYCRHSSLALLISSVCWATSDVFDPALHHKQWSSRRDCLALIEFSSSWCLQRPFSLCLEMACAIAGGVQSLPLCHTLQYSTSFGVRLLSFPAWIGLSGWQGLLKLGFPFSRKLVRIVFE